jgi:hypothetical protein
MPISRKLLLASALVLAGSAGIAQARPKSHHTHVLTVQLPGGGTEQVRYTGDIPPQVVLMPAPDRLAAFTQDALTKDWASPFAVLDRISAEMDQQMAALMRQVQAMESMPLVPNGPVQVNAGSLPPGAQSYTLIATMNGDTVCTRSMTVTSPGNHTPPKVVSQVSGNCGSGGNSVTPAQESSVRPPPERPHTIQVEHRAPRPLYAPLVHEVTWAR